MEKNNKQKIFIDWKQFGIMADKLADKIKKDVIENKIEYDGVHGIARGGLPLAILLSHRLDLKLLPEPTYNSLVADDISDSGATLDNCIYKKIACLYTSDWTISVPDYFIKTKTDKNSWCIFPWEEAC